MTEQNTATEAPAQTSLLGDGNSPANVETSVATDTDGGNWYDGLADEYKQNQHITKYTSQDEMAKGHLELVSKIGTMRDEGKAEGRTEYLNELGGKPEEATGYTFEAPEGANFAEDEINAFKEFAFENDLPQGQFEKLVAYEIERENKLHEIIDQQYKEALDHLKKDWGADYDSNLSQAENALREFGGSDEEIAHLSDRFGRDPVAIKMFQRIAASLSEDSPTRGADPVKTQGPGLSEMKAELAQLNNPMTSPIFKRANTSEKKIAMDRRIELARKIKEMEAN